MYALYVKQVVPAVGCQGGGGDGVPIPSYVTQNKACPSIHISQLNCLLQPILNY